MGVQAVPVAKAAESEVNPTPSREPALLRDRKPPERAMFTAHHTPSSPNALYYDPQMVRKLLGTEDKPRRTATRQTHVSAPQVRRVDSGETSETAIKFVEPERQRKDPRGKRQKVRAMCSAALEKLKPTR
ncbi:uncharacterized protein BKCO1_1000308 [Diplodia corticola]|uniref:Uncharacterized protein n=1 Tax=Diplodia corticola TaxID=236234 RepID=A0A1J9RJH9_9PEZI|nr:uncharacterized protein BKCO1_1000308 [Diplodia corticola]OJD40816.1 hypothetical protein BKCO1_1000308 [Diplodia corticola]